MKWKGLKPVDDGTYAVLYDESWGEWFGDVAKGALVAGIIIGVGVATWGVGLAIAAPGAVTAAGVASGIGTAATLGTTAAGGLSAAAGATILWGGGIIGGTTIAKWAGSDRKTVGVLVFNGFIEEIAVRAMARGLYNSLGGTVSSQDLLAIYSTLILCRGTFTDTGDGKAVSVWSLVKRQYSSFGGGSLEGDIASITSGGAGGFFKDMVTDMDTIPSFPKSFKTRNPINGTPIEFENAKDACVAAVGKLNSNEPKLSENLKYITEDDLEKLSESMEEITDAVVAAAPGAKAEGEEESEA